MGRRTRARRRNSAAPFFSLPAGELVPVALIHLDKGGTLALAGIYMTPIPEMDYGRCLFMERRLRSVTANTRRDGREQLKLAAEIPLTAHVEEFPLEAANEALRKLKRDEINGSAILRVRPSREGKAP